MSNFTDMGQKTSFDRALEIYNHLNAALEPVDKNCVEKIVCEAGALGKDVDLTQNPIVRYFFHHFTSKNSQPNSLGWNF